MQEQYKIQFYHFIGLFNVIKYMNEQDILNYIFQERKEWISGGDLEKQYLVANNKNKTISTKPEEYELKPREKIYSFYKKNGGCFIKLEEEY